MRKILNYFKDVRLELSKVVWPKKESVIKLTSIVFIISAIAGLYVGAVDFGLTKALELIINK